MEEAMEIDPNIMLELQIQIIELSQEMDDETEKIYGSKVVEAITNEQDMMLGYHELESKVKKSLREEEDLQAKLRERMKVLEDTHHRNTTFLRKT